MAFTVGGIRYKLDDEFQKWISNRCDNYNYPLAFDYLDTSDDNYVEISYDVSTKKFEIINIKGKSRDFRKINISSFKSGDIIFNPF